MGTEYRVLVKLPSAVAAESILAKAIGGGGRRTEQGWEYRSKSNAGPMPDVVAKVEPYGFYVCISGNRNGTSAELLGFVVAASAEYGEVRVELYE
jgi:hypothetical protein